MKIIANRESIGITTKLLFYLTISKIKVPLILLNIFEIKWIQLANIPGFPGFEIAISR